MNLSITFNENICKLNKYNQYYTHMIEEPNIIQNAIMNPINNDIKQSLYLETLYDINIYKILLYKIIMYYKSIKNSSIRILIYGILEKTKSVIDLNNYDNDLYNALISKMKIDKKLMNTLYDEIYMKVNNIYLRKNKGNFITNIKNYFDNNIFKFDGLEIENFKYMKKEEVYDKLTKIIFNLVEINDKKNTLHDSNKLILCEDDSTYTHCNRKKILINSRVELNNLLDIISYDFINPFKRDIITSLLYIDPIIDKYIYTQYINQKIFINIY
jgi:hypothetical protein